MVNWAEIAELDEASIKEHILSGYTSGRPFNPEEFPHLPTVSGAILDFGCGLGRNFSKLQQHCSKLYAFDLPDMLSKCQQAHPDSPVSFMGTWEELKSRDYDLVVANRVLHYLQDLKAVLSALSRCSSYLYVNSPTQDVYDKITTPYWEPSFSYKEGTEFVSLFRTLTREPAPPPPGGDI